MEGLGFLALGWAPCSRPSALFFAVPRVLPPGGPAEGASARSSRGPAEGGDLREPPGKECSESPGDGDRSLLWERRRGVAVALLRSRGWRRGAVEKSGLANRCRREAVILPGGGLGKAPEGEERPSTRWPRGKERSIELRLTTLGHEAARSSPGPQVGSVLLRPARRGRPIPGTRRPGAPSGPQGPGAW